MARSAVTPQTAKWLNLLRGSPTFVLVEGMNPGEEKVQQLTRVPSSIGACWISGTVTISSGMTIDAVHVVSTDDGGQLTETYVWVDGWVRAGDLPEVLELPSQAVFPFRYTLAVPLEDDRFSG